MEKGDLYFLLTHTGAAIYKWTTYTSDGQLIAREVICIELAGIVYKEAS